MAIRSHERFPRRAPRPPRALRLARAGVLAGLASVAGGSAAHAQGDFDEGGWDEAEKFLEEDEEEEEEEGEYEQPPVTAGGLFTKETYPLAEIERPLTITEGITEVRAAMDVDLSAGRPFEAFFGRVLGRYGIRDHIELQLAFDGLLPGGEIGPAELDAGRHQASMALGVESAIAYDLVDVKATAEIPLLPDSTLDLALGTPLRYRVTPKLAILAADRLLTIHTDGDRSPDLSVGAGALYQILPELAATARAELTLFEFDTERDPAVPVQAAIQYSPNHRLDLGLELGLLDLAAGESRFDGRSALLFGRARL